MFRIASTLPLGSTTMRPVSLDPWLRISMFDIAYSMTDSSCAAVRTSIVARPPPERGNVG
jgi:hypothetical protein